MELAYGFQTSESGDYQGIAAPRGGQESKEGSPGILLVGGLEHCLFLHISRMIVPIDEYFSEGFKPPTSILVLLNINIPIHDSVTI